MASMERNDLCDGFRRPDNVKAEPKKNCVRVFVCGNAHAEMQNQKMRKKYFKHAKRHSLLAPSASFHFFTPRRETNPANKMYICANQIIVYGSYSTYAAMAISAKAHKKKTRH